MADGTAGQGRQHQEGQLALKGLLPDGIDLAGDWRVRIGPQRAKGSGP